MVGGTGLTSAFGGDNDSVDTGSNYSGGGRIRVDAFDLAGLNGITFSPLGNTTAGSSVFVFPNPRPSLDIVSAAGQAIAEGEQGPVRINLPFNSPTTQQVTLRASNFGGVVPVSVLVTPVHGNPTEFQGEIDNSADNPAEVTLDVTIPTNVQVVLQAWTR